MFGQGTLQRLLVASYSGPPPGSVREVRPRICSERRHGVGAVGPMVCFFLFYGSLIPFCIPYCYFFLPPLDVQPPSQFLFVFAAHSSTRKCAAATGWCFVFLHFALCTFLFCIAVVGGTLTDVLPRLFFLSNEEKKLIMTFN
ncbi:hypothetical protein DFP73DRAFT_61274 [Morchella snyderi]|nr:hypothetical protein DFP73DRAFT_61274 [Morchella snyderi]